MTGENNFSSGYRDRSKYSAQGGGFDVGYSANDLLNVSLGVSFNKVDYQMPGALTKEQMEQDRRQYQPAADVPMMTVRINIPMSIWVLNPSGDHWDSSKSIFCMVKKICK